MFKSDFVRFFVRFGPVRTDIFVCAIILVRKHLAILVKEAQLPVRFVIATFVSYEGFDYIFARPQKVRLVRPVCMEYILTGNHAI